MLTLIENLPDSTIGVRVAGTVRAEEGREVLEPAVEAAAGVNGRVNALIVVEKGVNYLALAGLSRDDELRRAFRRRKWGRIAVLCDQKAVNAMIGAAMKRTRREVRRFSTRDEAEAVAWLGGAAE